MPGWDIRLRHQSPHGALYNNISFIPSEAEAGIFWLAVILVNVAQFSIRHQLVSNHGNVNMVVHVPPTNKPQYVRLTRDRRISTASIGSIPTLLWYINKACCNLMSPNKLPCKLFAWRILIMLQTYPLHPALPSRFYPSTYRVRRLRPSRP